MDARALVGFHIKNPVVYARTAYGIDELFSEAIREKSDRFVVSTDGKDVFIGTAHEDDADALRAFYLCACMGYFGVNSSESLDKQYISKSSIFASTYRNLGK